MSVKDRLKKFIEFNKLPVSTFEKSIKVTNGYVNSISKSIGIEKIELILELYPNLNLEWLFTGKSKMLKSELSDKSIDKNLEYIIELQKYRIVELENKTRKIKNYEIPQEQLKIVAESKPEK